MSFRSYLRQNWEYLLAVALMFVASGCCVGAAVYEAPGLAGLAIFCMFGFAYAAISFADAADFRRLMADAVRRQERSEVL